MKFGKVKFYADENIESHLITFIRQKGYKVESAFELGLSPRDDKFHLQEAKRRNCILITRDKDFLNHKKFPFSDLKSTGIVVLRSEEKDNINLGFALVCITDEIGASGNKNIHGLKIEIKGPKMIVYANIDGKIKSDTVDIRKEEDFNRELFT
ncbi:MAG: DUF5615 family PIN-like protein [Candidatus Thorarchaeota archaeon]